MNALSWFEKMGYTVRVLPAPWRNSLAMIYIDKMGAHISTNVDISDCRGKRGVAQKVLWVLENVKESVMKMEISSTEDLTGENSEA